MAPESRGEEESEPSEATQQPSEPESTTSQPDDDDRDDDEEEDEEPQLKYASLTKAQGALYRNGDAASAFLVAGDKMVGLMSNRLWFLAPPLLRNTRS